MNGLGGVGGWVGGWVAFYLPFMRNVPEKGLNCAYVCVYVQGEDVGGSVGLRIAGGAGVCVP